MAITAHTLSNGPRNLIVQFNLVSDGVDLTDFILLNVLDYTGNDQRQPNDFKVMSVTAFSSTAATCKLLFGNGADSDRLFFESIQDEDVEMNWEKQGGLSTLLPNPDMTVKITTSGFDAAGDAFTIVLRLKKKTTNANG